MTKTQQLGVMKRMQRDARCNAGVWAFVKSIRCMAKAVTGASPVLLYACVSSLEALVEHDTEKYAPCVDAAALAAATRHSDGDCVAIKNALVRHSTRVQRERAGLTRADVRAVGGPVVHSGVRTVAVIRTMLPNGSDLLDAVVYRMAPVIWVYPEAADALVDVLGACAALASRVSRPAPVTRRAKAYVHDKMWTGLKRVEARMRRG